VASWEHEPPRRDGLFPAFREVVDGWPPLWRPGSKRHPSTQPSARWHREGEGYAQYCSLETDGAWAELIRWEHIRSEAERQAYRARLWQLWPQETDIADLSTFDQIEACGLEPAIFIDDDHAACQELGDELRAAGYRGVLAPSASLPGVVNLTLFGGRRELYGRPTEVPNLRPDVYVNVNLAADLSPPPDHILRVVRYYGDAHLGYEEWLAVTSKKRQRLAARLP
jgi:RES domain-containing protein